MQLDWVSVNDCKSSCALLKLDPLVVVKRHAQAGPPNFEPRHRVSAFCDSSNCIGMRNCRHTIRQHRFDTKGGLMGSKAARSLLGPLVDGYRDLEPTKQTLSRPTVSTHPSDYRNARPSLACSQVLLSAHFVALLCGQLATLEPVARPI